MSSGIPVEGADLTWAGKASHLGPLWPCRLIWGHSHPYRQPADVEAPPRVMRQRNLVLRCSRVEHLQNKESAVVQ